MSTQQTIVEDKPIDQLVETQSFATSDNRLLLAQNMSEEKFLDAERKLRRKLDFRLLMTVWFIFILNYLDRVSSPCTILRIWELKATASVVAQTVN